MFRIGGVGIYVENIYAYGPGYYPHRKTVVKGKNDELPREQGRHNMVSLVDYFASRNYPFAPSDIHFKNCVIENAKNILNYTADAEILQMGTHLGELTLENVRFTDLKETSIPMASAEEPLTIRMKNVTVDFHESVTPQTPFIIEENSNTTLVIE
jgi:hypothetical protein